MDEHQACQDTEPPDPRTEPLLLLRQEQEQEQTEQQLQLRQLAIAHGAADRQQRRRRSIPWLTILGFCFLTFNSGMAIYQSQGERGAIAFVAFAYLDLLLLFFCLMWYESAEPGWLTRDRLKIVIWVLTTALTLLFTTKVAAVMPTVVAVVVWLMAFATVGGGFYAFFCYSDKE